MPITTQDLKYSKLSKDDRLLVDDGLMTVDGDFTSPGWELLKQVQFNEYKKQLVEAVQKVHKSTLEEEK